MRPAFAFCRFSKESRSFFLSFSSFSSSPSCAYFFSLRSFFHPNSHPKMMMMVRRRMTTGIATPITTTTRSMSSLSHSFVPFPPSSSSCSCGNASPTIFSTPQGGRGGGSKGSSAVVLPHDQSLSGLAVGAGAGLLQPSRFLLQRFPGARRRNAKVFLEVMITSPFSSPSSSSKLVNASSKGERGEKNTSSRNTSASSRGFFSSSPNTPLRLEIELFSSDTPVAAKHFEDFCTGKFNTMEGEGDGGERGGGEEEDSSSLVAVGLEGDGAEGLFPSSSSRLRPRLSYQYSTFHRLHKGFLLQGGDVYSSEGTHQISLFGEDTYDAPEETQKSFFSQPSFQDKRRLGVLPAGGGGRTEDSGYSPRGLLGTAVSAPHLNGSQFFILTTNKAEDVSHLDQTCICFGKVLPSCFPVLDEMERRVMVEAGGEIMEGYRMEIVNCGLA